MQKLLNLRRDIAILRDIVVIAHEPQCTPLTTPYSYWHLDYPIGAVFLGWTGLLLPTLVSGRLESGPYHLFCSTGSGYIGVAEEKAATPIHSNFDCFWAHVCNRRVRGIAAGRFQRTPDLGDLFRNLIGALCGIVFLGPTFRKIATTTRRAFQFFTIALVALQIYPVAMALLDEYRARHQFPVLSDFESPLEIQRWQGDADFRIDHTVYQSGQSSLRVNLNTDQYSGVSLQYIPQNWNGFSQFQFCAYNPSARPLSITCRIHDTIHTTGVQRYSDRFNRTYTLHHGWNTITIPLRDIQTAPDTRMMDLGHIRAIGIFATRLPHPRLMYLDDVRLFETIF